MNIKKRGKHSWLLTIEIGRDPVTGKRNRVFETIKGKRKDAELRYAELLQEIRNSNYQYSKPEKITLGEMFNRYLGTAKNRLGKATWETYEHIIEKRLRPALGNICIADLTPHQILNYYEDILENGRLDGKPGGLSGTTVRHHHVILRSTMQLAVDNKSLMYNPVASVKPPRKNKKEIQFLSAEELLRLLTYLEKNKSVINMPVYIAANTGARLSEVLALRWSDIDFEGKTLLITRSLQRSKDGPYISDVKTSSSRRQITLTDEDIALLKSQRKAQAQQKLLLGKDYNNQDLICTRQDGSPMIPITVGSRFRRVARMLGMQVSFHGLRHSHATILLQQGASVKFVSARLGHSSTSFTMDVYGHRLISDDRKIANLFREALNEAKKAAE